MNELDGLFQVFFFAFGAAIGSFLNVCIVRLPQGKSIVTPGSHCMACGKPVRWFDNIPLISFFCLLGKCRDCGVSFSFRYAAIEFLTGLAFWGTYLYFGLTWTLIPWFFLIGSLIVATCVDLELRIIPDELSIWGIPAGILASLCLPEIQFMAGPSSLLTGWFLCVAFAGAAFLLMLIDAWRRRSSLAREDALLMGGVFAAIFIQYLVFVLPLPRVLSGMAVGLAASLQGVIVGGGALYLLGLVGAMLISKRVVTLIDLKGITEQPARLFQDLVTQGYIDQAGEILPRFRTVASCEDLDLGEGWAKDKEAVYNLIVDCQEGGVMGGGDVKLMALIGAFLGWKLALLTIVLAPFLGIPFAIAEKIRTKSSAIAFGPYLAAAALVSLFFGKGLIAWIISGYGMY